MDGWKQMTSDDLDRELAEALNVQPSNAFRARIRSRVSDETMRTTWRFHMPLTVYAGLAGILAATAIWMLAGSSASPRMMEVRHDAGAASRPASPARVSAADTPAPRPVPPPLQARVARNRPQPVAVPAGVPVASGHEVLIADSERAGVRLLFESVASGRLELPEDMLQDLSLPVVEARSGFPAADSPWNGQREGAVQ